MDRTPRLPKSLRSPCKAWPRGRKALWRALDGEWEAKVLAPALPLGTRTSGKSLPLAKPQFTHL